MNALTITAAWLAGWLVTAVYFARLLRRKSGEDSGAFPTLYSLGVCSIGWPVVLVFRVLYLVIHPLTLDQPKHSKQDSTAGGNS